MTSTPRSSAACGQQEMSALLLVCSTYHQRAGSAARGRAPHLCASSATTGERAARLPEHDHERRFEQCRASLGFRPARCMTLRRRCRHMYPQRRRPPVSGMQRQCGLDAWRPWRSACGGRSLAAVRARTSAPSTHVTTSAGGAGRGDRACFADDHRAEFRPIMDSTENSFPDRRGGVYPGGEFRRR